MKELTFAEMTIRDFKEFRGLHKINLRKLGSGLHYVRGFNEVEPRLGSNGAGKSSMWDALSWCLFGRTPSGLRGTDVKTWGGSGHAEVAVRIISDEGEQAWVQRSTKTNGLTIDDALVEQAEVDRAIGMSFETFQHTILLGQGQPLFFDLKPAEKMARLSEALALDRWEERSVAAKKSVGELEQQIAKAEGGKAELDRTLRDCERQEVDLKKRRTEWDAEQKALDMSRLSRLKEQKKALRHAVDKLADHDLALDRNETEARATRKRLADLKAEHQKTMSTLGASSAALGILLDERQKLAGDEAPESCPTCGQKISGAKQHRDHITKRLRALGKEVETARGLNESFVNAAADLQRKIDAAAKELAGFEAAADDARDNFTRAQQAKAQAEAAVKQLEADQAANEIRLNPYAELLKKCTRQANQIAGQLEEMDALIALAERKKTRVSYWVQGFRQVRLYLIQEVLDELTGTIQNLLPQVGLEGWIVELSSERETQSGKAVQALNVDIFKPGLEKKVRWESWSGGEAQRLRIVGAIALSQVLLRRAGVDCNLIILDEPTRGISEKGVAEIIEFLSDLGKDYQIFYVDHMARETKRFASVVSVRRDGFGARMELV